MIILLSMNWSPVVWLLPSYSVLGLLPGTQDTPIKENADGAKGIFGNARRVWAAALRLDPS